MALINFPQESHWSPLAPCLNKRIYFLLLSQCSLKDVEMQSNITTQIWKEEQQLFLWPQVRKMASEKIERVNFWFCCRLILVLKWDLPHSCRKGRYPRQNDQQEICNRTKQTKTNKQTTKGSIHVTTTAGFWLLGNLWWNVTEHRIKAFHSYNVNFNLT